MFQFKNGIQKQNRHQKVRRLMHHHFHAKEVECHFSFSNEQITF